MGDCRLTRDELLSFKKDGQSRGGYSYRQRMLARDLHFTDNLHIIQTQARVTSQPLLQTDSKSSALSELVEMVGATGVRRA